MGATRNEDNQQDAGNNAAKNGAKTQRMNYIFYGNDETISGIRYLNTYTLEHDLSIGLSDHRLFEIVLL